MNRLASSLARLILLGMMGLLLVAIYVVVICAMARAETEWCSASPSAIRSPVFVTVSIPVIIERIHRDIGVSNVDAFEFIDCEGNIRDLASPRLQPFPCNYSVYALVREKNACAERTPLALFRPRVFRVNQSRRTVRLHDFHEAIGERAPSGRLPHADQFQSSLQRLTGGQKAGLVGFLLNLEPRSFIGLKLLGILLNTFSGHTTLPEGQPGVYQDQRGRHLSPKNLLFLLGCVVGVTGFVLLFKVLNEVYLNSRFNEDMAVGRFLLAAVLVWIGGWLVLVVFGLVS